MNPEVVEGLTAWVAGLSVEEIQGALEGSACASQLRDPATLARFLYARANGLA